MPKTSSPRRRRFPRSRLWRGCNGGEKLERLLRWPSLIRRCTPTVRIWSGEHGLYWRANAGGYTAIESFNALMGAPGGYRPSLSESKPAHRKLADLYDAAQERRGDPRRANRNR